MASIFCPECGAKTAYTLSKPKFCQTCGEKFKLGSNVVHAAADEEIPEDVPVLQKLDYSIEIEGSAVTLGDLFNSPLSPNSVSLTSRSVKDHKVKTKEEFLSQSLAECASRQQPAITEDGQE